MAKDELIEEEGVVFEVWDLEAPCAATNPRFAGENQPVLDTEKKRRNFCEVKPHFEAILIFRFLIILPA